MSHNLRFLFCNALQDEKYHLEKHQPWCRWPEGFHDITALQRVYPDVFDIAQKSWAENTPASLPRLDKRPLPVPSSSDAGRLYVFTAGLALSGGSDSKEAASNAGDLSSVTELGRSTGEGNGNSLQYSWLENSMDRGAWHTIVHGVTKSWTRLNDLTLSLSCYQFFSLQWAFIISVF